MKIDNKFIVRVMFRDGNGANTCFAGATYEYYTEGNLTEFDKEKTKFAVVDSPYTGYTVARIVEAVELLEKNYRDTLKPVIALFSDDWHVTEKNRKKRLANLEKRLEEEIAKQNKLQTLISLAAENAAFKELLEEYKNLTE